MNGKVREFTQFTLFWAISGERGGLSEGAGGVFGHLSVFTQFTRFWAISGM